MASSDYVNYATRPNKAVERKLIFDVLSIISPVLNLPSYRYIGLGAPWFVDFVMAHRYLKIENMISIERDEILASRAEFNRPYACVQVIHGDIQIVLEDLELEELPLLVWLDYDSSLEGSVLQDLSTLCSRAPTGSIIIVTVNAHRNRLPTHDDNDYEFENFADRLRALAGDLIPSQIPKEATRASGYPAYLVSVLFAHMHRQVRKAGREGEALVPLYNIGYSDNAPMVTLGGAIADALRAQEIKKMLEDKNMGDFLDEQCHLRIGVPPLTFKEKASLDQLLPKVTPPTEQEVESLGFKLKPSQIKSYHRFYRHYPVFGEVAV